ncbi:MAG: response regulator [Methyloceanibacter sp.]
MPTILVVEDEFLIRAMLSEKLQDAGFKVLEASTGEEAVTILEQVDSIELVLTDVRMPGSIDGFALAKWIAVHRSAMPVIVVSGHANEADIIPGQAFFRKPYDVEKLAGYIHQKLGL